MFIIRDKKTGETWFAGTVYEPLSTEDDDVMQRYKNNGWGQYYFGDYSKVNY